MSLSGGGKRCLADLLTRDLNISFKKFLAGGGLHIDKYCSRCRSRTSNNLSDLVNLAEKDVKFVIFPQIFSSK